MAMEVVLWTVVYGTLVFLVWRALTAVRAYVQIWRALMKLPQTKSHWLYGHLKQVSNNNNAATEVAHFYCKDEQYVATLTLSVHAWFVCRLMFRK